MNLVFRLLCTCTSVSSWNDYELQFRQHQASVCPLKLNLSTTIFRDDIRLAVGVEAEHSGLLEYLF